MEEIHPTGSNSLPSNSSISSEVAKNMQKKLEKLKRRKLVLKEVLREAKSNEGTIEFSEELWNKLVKSLDFKDTSKVTRFIQEHFVNVENKKLFAEVLYKFLNSADFEQEFFKNEKEENILESIKEKIIAKVKTSGKWIDLQKQQQQGSISYVAVNEMNVEKVEAQLRAIVPKLDPVGPFQFVFQWIKHNQIKAITKQIEPLQNENQLSSLRILNYLRTTVEEVMIDSVLQSSSNKLAKMNKFLETSSTASVSESFRDALEKK